MIQPYFHQNLRISTKHSTPLLQIILLIKLIHKLSSEYPYPYVTFTRRKNASCIATTFVNSPQRNQKILKLLICN